MVRLELVSGAGSAKQLVGEVDRREVVKGSGKVLCFAASSASCKNAMFRKLVSTRSIKLTVRNMLFVCLRVARLLSVVVLMMPSTGMHRQLLQFYWFSLWPFPSLLRPFFFLFGWSCSGCVYSGSCRLRGVLVRLPKGTQA